MNWKGFGREQTQSRILTLVLYRRRGDQNACSWVSQRCGLDWLFILCFVDRASRHKFLLITNLTHFFLYLFIHFISLHVSSIKCSSSGDRIVLIHHLMCRGVFRPRQTRQLPRAVDLKGRLLSCQSY